MDIERNAGGRILIVDNDTSASKSMAHVLRQGGYQVFGTAEGAQAVALIQAQRPELVLLDLVLPDLPGTEVLRRIRSDPAANDVSVALMSPLWGSSVHRPAGADGYIVRPISNHELLARVRDMLRQRELILSLRASEARYRDLFERNLTGNFVCDPDGRLSLCNSSFARIHGYESPEAALAAAPALFRDAQERAALFGALRPEPGIDTHERWVARRHGGRILVLERLAGIWDADRRLTAVQGYHLDVTERRRAEESVRAHAALLANAQRIGRMGSWSLDIADQSMVWSEETCALFGITAAEFRGTREHFYSFVLPEDRPRLAADYARVVASGGLLDVESEFRIRRPDGEMRWMMVRGNAVVGVDGRIGRRFGMYMDITERKLAEERVLRLNRVYLLLSGLNSALLRIRDRQTLFDEACRVSVEVGKMRGAWIGLVEDETQPVRVVSQAGELRGYHETVKVSTQPDPAGLGPFGVAIVENRTVVCNDVEHDALFARWRRQALERGFRSAAIFPLRLAGRVFGGFVAYSDLAQFFDAEEVRIFEELAANISFAAEIIERDGQRRTSEQALRESEERFRAMVEQAALGICLVSIDLRFLRVNARFCEIAGHDAAQLLGGATCLGITHPDDRALHDRAVAQVVAGAASVTIEQRCVRADGTVVWTRMTLSTLRSTDGTPSQFLVMAEDISERRTLEDQLRQSQRLESIGQLTGGVAHDFNNLLTVILGNAELIAEGGGPAAEQLQLARVIVDAALRGGELTQRLLVFARRQPLHPAVVDVNALVSGADPLQRRTLGEHIEIEVALAPDLWMARVDPAQLESSLLNLTINARDAMPTGGRVLIETANVTFDEAGAGHLVDAAPGDYVRISVSDDGIGIPAEHLSRVFEPFFTTKPTGKGTGLGLAMVYGFVRQSGGYVQVESELGAGTAVHMYLPRAAGDEPAAAARATAADLVGGTETLLLVEDDDLVRRYAYDQLVNLGYRVLEARNGREAIDTLQSGVPIDLLFTDVVMPGGISGRQLADFALGLRPGLKVLYTSGYAEDTIVYRGRLEPGILLLEKPYQRADLARKIRDALD